MSLNKRAAFIAVFFFAYGLHVQAQTTSSRGDGTQPPAFNVITGGEAAALVGGGETPAGGVTVVRIPESAFQPGSGLITFSEFPVGTANPTYAPGDYGGTGADPTVTFAGFFGGQALGDGSTCPPGAALSGCVVGTAANPLTLAGGSPTTAIVNDGANPTSPVLSGSPTFNGPIAVLFSSDVAGVGLGGGFFDNPGGTAITAFARDGTVLGSVVNTGTGIEFLGLVTSNGSNSIAGLLFSLVGAEAAGFAIDNLRFGRGDTVGPPQPPRPSVPVPGLNGFGLLILLVGLGIVGLVATRR